MIEMKTVKYILLIIMGILIIYSAPIYVKALELDTYQLLESTETEDYDFCGNAQDDFCANFSNVIVIIGYLIIILKIAIPLLIIVKTSINLLPLITSGNPESFKKAMTSLLISFGAGVFIFFAPTIINIFLNSTGKYSESWEDNGVCRSCVLSPTSNGCQMAVAKVNHCKQISKG